MDPAEYQREYARLTEFYRAMRDGELENVAAEAYDLTDIARECLQYEIASRKLKIALNLTPPASEEDFDALPPSDDGFVPDDSDLFIVEVAADMNELLKVKHVLDEARIECFLGEAKVRDPEALSETFDGGIQMRVWRAAFEDASALLKERIPGYADRQEEQIPDAEVRCPKCNSDGVIFEERETDPNHGKATRTSRFRWRCDDCGYEWEDDGVAEDKENADLAPDQ
jgi:DNA-directed RNA polymerase subunit M/transcription elongation factor TFIIS